MKKIVSFLVMLLFVVVASSQENRPRLVAGYPVNYREDSVSTYTLPDLFTCMDGQEVPVPED
jgi:hypothetical protein